MKPATSITIIIFLALGAILYSDSPVLGMTQSSQPTQPAMNTSAADNSGFGPDPLQAGALAAKPNGVPTCLTLCQPGGVEDPDNDGDTDINTTKTQSRHVMVTRTVATSTPVTRTIVVQAAPVTMAQPVTVVQPRPVIVAQAQPTIIQRAAALPATGTTTANTALGIASIITATYFYLRARHRT